MNFRATPMEFIILILVPSIICYTPAHYMNLLFMEYKRELTAKIVLTSFLPPTPWPLSFLFLHFIFAAIEKVGAKTVILLSAAPFSKSRNKSYFTFEKSLYLGHCFCRSHKRDCEMRIDEKPQTNFKVRISG